MWPAPTQHQNLGRGPGPGPPTPVSPGRTITMHSMPAAGHRGPAASLAAALRFCTTPRTPSSSGHFLINTGPRLLLCGSLSLPETQRSCKIQAWHLSALPNPDPGPELEGALAWGWPTRCHLPSGQLGQNPDDARRGPGPGPAEAVRRGWCEEATLLGHTLTPRGER